MRFTASIGFMNRFRKGELVTKTLISQVLRVSYPTASFRFDQLLRAGVIREAQKSGDLRLRKAVVVRSNEGLKNFMWYGNPRPCYGTKEYSPNNRICEACFVSDKCSKKVKWL